MPRATPRTNVVFPAPSSPVSRTRSPTRRRLPKRSPKASVSAGDLVTWSRKVVVAAEPHFHRMAVGAHDHDRGVLREDAQRSQAGPLDQNFWTDAHELGFFPAGQRVLQGRPVGDRNVGAADNASGARKGGKFLHLAHEPVGDVATAEPSPVEAAALLHPSQEPHLPALPNPAPTPS